MMGLPFGSFRPFRFCQDHPLYVGAALLGYLAVVGAVRQRRVNAIHRKFQAKYEAGLLTARDAQEIIHGFGFYDMPSLFLYSLSFALFKTYGIPSISKLLAATKELKSDENVSKRYADTEILIGTWMTCPLSGMLGSPEKGGQNSEEKDPRGAIALARVNWLHSQYSIKNDDYLYTLSLFILEPIKWIQKYGWRSLSPLEQQANFLFWVEIGKRMDIKNIPETIEDLRAWSVNYEDAHMLPAQTNHDVAHFTTEEMLYVYPEALGIKNTLRRVVACLLEDPVREAMMLPKQPGYLRPIVDFSIHSMMFFVRFFCLPRRKLEAVVRLDEASSSGRMFPTRFQPRPWYKPRRRGVLALFDRITVMTGMYRDPPGPQYRCEGYRLEELGPLKYEEDGHDKVIEMAEQIHGCPIKAPYALQSPSKETQTTALDN
ncbi:hypothetical protein HGRIS_010820 [Hohenbuehelia grisea]|uniref:ER-bound oxygenase mpaB/mpaB'/Rubber oxygenase catalytic domain-containing protein n=1 Tax=Hohenbuehelia grisea TaxID=104357 RepID=A0ABR3IXW8_9AGAR